ncbi:MAG: sulfurtransferase TusA family protein [Gammaproteobacteria bacterium]|nr:sulfurtransferase TusA family protein [Gammaproteobacteria bacterium]
MNTIPTELDLRRLLCPLPVIRTQDRIKSLARGDRLQLICTDPGVLEDIPVWCRMNGHRILSLDETDAEIRILIEVGED